MRKHLSLFILPITTLLFLGAALADIIVPGWNWGPEDYVFAVLFFIAFGCALSVATQLVKRPLYRAIALGAVLVAFALIWIEAAVGIFN